VVLNLLQNALKFTFDGSITLKVSYNRHASELIVSVADTGCGISSDDRAKLFTMFGKLESSSAMNSTGIGLGLNICKQIVEMFDGGIYLDENFGPGS
jgi:signal transduction histidine kinase